MRISPHEEGRHRDAEERCGEEEPAREAAPVEGGVDPGRDPDDDGDEHAGDGELDGRGQALDEDRLDGAAEPVADAEVALKNAPEIGEELDRDRAVEPQLRPHGLALRLRRLDAEDRDQRVAEETEHDERDRGDDEHHDDRLA